LSTSGPLKRAIQEENWKEAAELLEIRLQKHPDDAPGWYWKAVCLEKEGRRNEAIDAARRAAELDPGHRATKSLLEELEGAPETVLEESSAGMPSDPSAIPETQADSGLDPVPVTEASSGVGTSTFVMAQWKEGEIVEGRYEVRQVIRGGMGEVAFVFDRELGLELAVKTPLPAVLASANGRTRFIREAESWIALGLHPNICTAYYLRELAGSPRLFIEYIDGGSLSSWLKFSRKRSLAEKLDIAIQIASGMEHAHSFLWKDASGVEHRGIVHRDLKPANILLGSDGLARVTDFGLVGRGSETEIVEESRKSDTLDLREGVWGTVTMGGSVMGTPPYMPPEQWKGAHFAQAAADIYAFGVILFEILCGLRPFALSPEEKGRRPELQLLRWKKMHLEEEPRNPLSLHPNLDPELAALSLECLAKEGGDRPESFRDIGNRLRKIYGRLCGEKYPRPRPRASLLLADSLNNRGVSYQSLQRPQQAEDAWKEALQISPHHREAAYNLAIFDWIRGVTLEETRSVLGSFRENGRDGGNDDWRNDLLRARLLLLLGEWKQAMELFRRCFEASGESSRVALDYSLALCAEAGMLEWQARMEKRLHVHPATPIPGEKPKEDHARSLWTQAADILGRCGGVLRHDPRLLVAYALAKSSINEENAARRLMSAAGKQQPGLPENVAAAAARLLPGQIPCRGFETPGVRIVQMELSAEKQLGIGLAYNNRIVIWDLASGKIRNNLDLRGPRPRSIALDVNRNAVWVSTEAEAVTALSLDNGRVLARLASHSGFLNDLEISADGRQLLGGGTARLLYVWDLDSREILAAHKTDIGYLTRIRLAADCRTAIVGGSSGGALIIDIEAKETTRRLGVESGLVSCVGISPGARRAALGMEDGGISVWDLREVSSPPVSISGHGKTVCFLHLDASSRYLLSASRDCSFRIRDILKEKNLACMVFEEPVQSGCASAGLSHVLIAAGLREIRHLDLREKPEWLPNWAIASPVSVGELESKSREFRKYLARARNSLDRGDFAAVLEALDSARQVPGFDKFSKLLELSEELNRRLPRKTLRSSWEEKKLEENSFPVHAVAVSPDGEILLSAGGDRKLRMYRDGTQTELSSTEAEWAERAISISPCGRMALSGGLENEIHLWDLRKGELIRSMEGHEGQIHALDFRFDGAFALSASADGTLRYWDLRTGICLKILEGHESEVLDCAIHPSGKVAASCGEDTILLWDLNMGSAVTPLNGHKGPVRAVEWTEDGRKLVSAGSDGDLRIWNPRNARCIHTIPTGHALECIALSEDDRVLCTGNQNGELGIWDLRTRQLLASHGRHHDRIHSIAMPRNGCHCYTASADGSLRSWYLDWIPETGYQNLAKARPYLEIFLQQRKLLGSRGSWAREHVEKLRKKLRRLGFNDIPAEKIEDELERLGREEEQNTLLEDLELSRQIRVIRSPAEKEKKRITTKWLIWGGGAALLLLSFFLFDFVPSLSLVYDIAETQEIRNRIELQQGGVYAALDPSAPCLEEEENDDLRTLKEERDFRKLVRAAYCLSRLREDSLAGTFFDVIRHQSKPNPTSDQLQIMTVFLSNAPEAVCEDLARELDDGDEAVRDLAAEALALHEGERCHQLYLDAASVRDPLTRIAVSAHFTSLLAGGDIPAAKAFEIIRKFYDAAWPEIRRNAAGDLWIFRGEDARKLAKKMLKDKDPKVQFLAREYLSSRQ